MHTLKVAVIELDSDRRDFDIDAVRRVIHSRPYKLEPFCYQLVDIPLKLHHPMCTEIYSVGPLTAGSGLNITVWSYVDQLNVSVLADGATVDDPHEVNEAVVEELVEIRRAAGLSERLTVIEGALAPA